MIHSQQCYLSCLYVVTCRMHDAPKFPKCNSVVSLHSIILYSELKIHNFFASAESRKQTASSAASVWLDCVAQVQQHMTKADWALPEWASKSSQSPYVSESQKSCSFIGSWHDKTWNKETRLLPGNWSCARHSWQGWVVQFFFHSADSFEPIHVNVSNLTHFKFRFMSPLRPTPSSLAVWAYITV